VTRDAQGLEVTGTTDAADLFDRAVGQLQRFQPEVVELATKLATEHPDFPLGNALAAYLSLTSTDAGDVPDAAAALDGARRDGVTGRERAHLAAADAWVAGDMAGAAKLLDRLVVDHPRDVLALTIGHQIDFFTGAAPNLRDRVARSLPAWSEIDAAYGFVQGMYAFGLEECGSYDRAEALGREAVDRNPDDVWGIHAVVHTHEMRGEIDRGVAFLDEHRTSWNDGNFLNVHNGWHYALFMLELGDAAGALRIYDELLSNAVSEKFVLDMVDASAMLWRLWIDGVDVGDRWAALADVWAEKPEQPFYVFNDMHATMSFVGAGRLDDAEAVVERLERYAAEPDDGLVTNKMMTRDAGLPACRGVLAFARGDDRACIDALWAVRPRLHHFGGSHAQRDAVQRTLLVAALRAGDDAMAHALVGERLGERPVSVWTWQREAERRRAAGDAAGADEAERTASELQSHLLG
jgi:tetratricopeptide (TPR) repeat protein